MGSIQDFRLATGKVTKAQLDVVEAKANLGLKTGVRSGFRGFVKTQPATGSDLAEITLGILEISGNYGEAQLANRSDFDGSIALTDIVLTSSIDFFMPRGSFFLVFGLLADAPSEADGFVDVNIGGTDFRISWLASEPKPNVLRNNFQFAKVFGDIFPQIGYDIRRSSATNPTNSLRQRIRGNQVKDSQLLALNQTDNTKVDMIAIGEFDRPNSSGIRDFDWFEVLPIQDIMAGGNDGTGGRSNPAKGHLYNLKIKDNDLVSWSYSGTTITLNTTASHSFEVGQKILVEGLVSTTNTPNSENYPDDATKPVGMRNTKWVVSAVPNNTTIEFIADDIPTGTPTFDGSGGQISKNNIGAIEIVDLQAGGTYELWWQYYDDTADKFPSTRFTPTLISGSNRYISHKIAIFPNYNEANVVLIWGQTENKKNTFVDAVNDWSAPNFENGRLGYSGGSVTLGRVVVDGSSSNLSTAVFKPAQASEIRK